MSYYITFCAHPAIVELQQLAQSRGHLQLPPFDCHERDLERLNILRPIFDDEERFWVKYRVGNKYFDYTGILSTCTRGHYIYQHLSAPPKYKRRGQCFVIDTDTSGYYKAATKEAYINVVLHLHRIVAQNCCPGFEPDLHAGHIMPILSNNSRENLIWQTPEENSAIASKLISVQNNFNKDEINFIVESYLNGKKIVDIAKELNTQKDRVLKILKQSSVYQKKNRKFSEEDKTIIYKLWDEGCSVASIAHHLATSSSTIRYILKKSGRVLEARDKSKDTIARVVRDYINGETNLDILASNYSLTYHYVRQMLRDSGITLPSRSKFHSEETKELAKQLKHEGLSLAEIGRQLEISVSTIGEWVRN